MNVKVKQNFRSGFVGIVGKPNVGKSTLLNQLIAEKVAAISRRPQTTRNKITGICHLPGGQIILMDTPGIHDGRTKLNRFMVETARKTFDDADVILFLIDAKRRFREEDEYVLELIKKSKTPKILAVNKIDLIPKNRILGLIDELRQRENFLHIIPLSGLHGDGLDILKKVLLEILPEGPEYFPPGMVTDCPEKFIAAEMIREKIIKLTHLELPYAAAVEVEKIVEGKKGVLVVDAAISIERESQKKILIGKGGERLKMVGQYAREEIEKLFGSKVYLNLFVRVKKNWRQDDRYLKDFGYSHDSY